MSAFRLHQPIGWSGSEVVPFTVGTALAVLLVLFFIVPRISQIRVRTKCIQPGI